MSSEENQLKISNDIYDVYITKKVFDGYILKKFKKGNIVNAIEQREINLKMSFEQIKAMANHLLSY